jgi:hypothetical protein
MSDKLRSNLRRIVWILLLVCIPLDGLVAEYTLFPGPHGCIIHFDNSGRIMVDPPTLGDWAFAGGLLLFQVLLFVALFRLRNPLPTPISVVHTNEQT